MAKKAKNTKLIPWIFAIVFSIAVYAYVMSQPQQVNVIHQLQLSTLDTEFNITNVTVQYNPPPGEYYASRIVNYYAYLALSTQQQDLGYMNQTWTGDCNMHYPCIGMIFDIGNQTNVCFWMKNTEIPLKQIWVADNGTVTFVYTATPYSTQSICNVGTLVLETNTNSTIIPGDRITIGN